MNTALNVKHTFIIWSKITDVLLLLQTIATYKGRYEVNNKLWHASFDISKASHIVLRDNTAAGSERIGFHIRGEGCYGDNPEERWEANFAHTTLHGIHIGFHDGLPDCLKIANFILWKSWDFGVFGYPASRVIIQDTVVADNNLGNESLEFATVLTFSKKWPLFLLITSSFHYFSTKRQEDGICNY